MISDTYFQASKKFRNIVITACADTTERAAQRGAQYGVAAMSTDALLDSPDVDIVLNLTPPNVHAAIDLQALARGKHVYSEKPFAVSMDEAKQILTTAAERNLRVGCAPDTFLGGSLQSARKFLDDGWIGKPVAGTAIVASRGPEKWPHAPMFYDKGAGPMMDLGPYYCTALVNLLGPARSVMAAATRGTATRTMGAEVAPAYRDRYKPYGPYPVNVNTHLSGTVEFQNGALVTVIASFDVYKHGHAPIELYGTEGSLQIGDPNFFGSPLKICRREWRNPETPLEWQEAPILFPYTDNCRSIGLADMADAIAKGRPHRCNSALACHVLEIMLAFEASAASGRRVELKTTCDRPAPLPMGLEEGEIR